MVAENKLYYRLQAGLTGTHPYAAAASLKLPTATKKNGRPVPYAQPGRLRTCPDIECRAGGERLSFQHFTFLSRRNIPAANGQARPMRDPIDAPLTVCRRPLFAFQLLTPLHSFTRRLDWHQQARMMPGPIVFLLIRIPTNYTSRSTTRLERSGNHRMHRPESVVMWAHYCDEGTGICFGIDETNLVNQFAQVFVDDVEYTATNASMQRRGKSNCRRTVIIQFNRLRALCCFSFHTFWLAVWQHRNCNRFLAIC